MYNVCDVMGWVHVMSCVMYGSIHSHATSPNLHLIICLCPGKTSRDKIPSLSCMVIHFHILDCLDPPKVPITLT